VFPTRQSLGIMKAKLKGAETGHSLLKRKSEALTKFDFPANYDGQIVLELTDVISQAISRSGSVKPFQCI
jgi:V-type H+-transporting ATPase subunit D